MSVIFTKIASTLEKELGATKKKILWLLVLTSKRLEGGSRAISVKADQPKEDHLKVSLQNNLEQIGNNSTKTIKNKKASEAQP